MPETTECPWWCEGNHDAGNHWSPPLEVERTIVGPYDRKTNPAGDERPERMFVATRGLAEEPNGYRVALSTESDDIHLTATEAVKLAASLLVAAGPLTEDGGNALTAGCYVTQLAGELPGSPIALLARFGRSRPPDPAEPGHPIRLIPAT